MRGVEAEKSNYNKMISGESYHAVDPELFAMQANATRKYEAYNLLLADNGVARDEALRGLFGTVSGWALVEPPIYVDFGIHIHLGARQFRKPSY